MTVSLDPSNIAGILAVIYLVVLFTINPLKGYVTPNQYVVMIVLDVALIVCNYISGNTFLLILWILCLLMDVFTKNVKNEQRG